LAAAAREGDSIARNVLWLLCRRTVDAAVASQWGLPRLWDRGDLEQESFLVFVDVCARWDGDDFAHFFEQEFAAELRRHVRRERRRQRHDVSVPTPLGLEPDPHADRAYRLAELLESLSSLPPAHGLALRLHLFFGVPLDVLGRRLGLSKRAAEGLLPLGRRAAEGGLESEHELLERRTRALYLLADPEGNVQADARKVRAVLNLRPREYRRLVATLEQAGVLTGRRRGRTGKLPPEGLDEALRLLRGSTVPPLG